MALDYRRIGKRISQARTAAGFSQEELGKKIYLSTAAISLFESGERNISLDLLSKIATSLGVTLKELIEGYDQLPTYISFRATKEALDDPKFKKALDEAVKSVHEQSKK